MHSYNGKEIKPGDIEFHVEDEWTAVYVHGNLVTVGDSYYADEWLQQLLGVATVHDSGFMRGGNRHEDVAKTLDEIDEYYNRDNARLQRIAELEEELANLRNQ